jgi:sugar transferase (PEP-CTERM/EpsH1 system associated)
MKILCLTSRLPYPPNRGDRLRAFHFIKHLANEHDLTLVSFIADKTEREHIAPLQAYCQDVHVLKMSARRSMITALTNFWRRVPLQTLYYRSPSMQHRVDELITAQHFDATYVHLFRMAPYVADHPELYRVVDLTDMISHEVTRSLPYRNIVSRLIYAVERPRIARYERWIAQHFEETWLISAADRDAFVTVCPEANVRVITNGVDTDTFYPTGQHPISHNIVFVGHMRVFHNIDAAIHLAQAILPRVRQHIPSATLTLVGADPAPQIRRLDDIPSVTVTGFVPDLNQALNAGAVFVAPLRFAAGVQNKVLEAMAAGRPVVTTSVVNAGLGAQPGRHLFVADDPDATATQIVKLLKDATLSNRIGQAGRRFVQQKFTWNQVIQRMREIEKAL